MKTERELFEEWYKSEYPLDYEHYVNEQDIGVFTKLYLRCFASWTASVQREGYKLVPVEPTTDMYLAGTHELTQIDFRDLHDNDSIQVYKAMIGAAP